ncbi:glycosyl transferase, group 1 [Phaeodactylum tricornutum CCAP 1055/1]|jgi:sulfoquinovosyltransferase|uniref:Glycosyl transferase, group 1 n=2 Tax=Phaeodactylum tricornutum TaxID=2850 RepID=B7GDV1_PHATC|nr:glycosyl transferase, group 1 [Phaeodactylum tricornutum CCAP 1055/1]EEC43145.1 glycosyl transferase, group 1 [Phaeodactylum tricornutum CCAP 1055/1]|eukprot:XP_002185276.1 glycosyl transferase, group 1 [Phaeodactylum tricornutum CCAP 1055/1]
MIVVKSALLIVCLVATACIGFVSCFQPYTSAIPPPCTSSVSSSSVRLEAAARSSDAPPLRRNPPRKICLMVEPTPFTHVSGYANRFKEMLKFMAKAGDEVDILTVDTKTPAHELPTACSGFSIKHTQGFTFPLYNQISLTFDLPEMKGAQMLEKFKPDLIHVTSPGFMLFASIFYARVLCIPLVMSYHTHLPSYGKNYLSFVPGIENFCWELLRWAHARADLTLVTSPQMQEELTRNGIPRVDVWRKGIDTDRFDPKFRSTSMREKMTRGNADDFLMVYVGRLGAEKRLKDIKPMLERMPNARLCIVGKGPQEEELHDYFKGTNTVFTGQLDGDELSSAFASADVFVMPSDSETLGFVVLESMASGVPVVGAAAGGIPDIIDDGKTGFLVPPGDIAGFVSRLESLRNAKFRTQMAKAARKETERWGWEAATSYLRNVQYEKALINFHSRAFGGFGRPRSGTMWRLLGWRMRRVIHKVAKPKAVFSSIWRKLSFGRQENSNSGKPAAA